jgi:dipeptidyl aminopeptidase/acylaminoacyl peptidase
MNCEQVEEHLSAYLDNMLAPQEHWALTIHLQNCLRCMILHAELRQNDILLAQLPRIIPSPALHARIFSTPELVAHARTASTLWTTDAQGQTHPPAPQMREYPTSPSSAALLAHLPSHPSSAYRPVRQQRRRASLTWTLVAVLVAILATAGVLGLHSWQPTRMSTLAAITPPAAGPGSGQTIPLAAGTRFVFLQDAALWSVLVDGQGYRPERLTPADVTVAAGWEVSPQARGHLAGDMLAYIDQQSARIHTVRSDGQLDTAVPQALLTGKRGLVDWTSSAGATILHSLVWSMDGSTLAFVGAADGQMHLYLYTLDTRTVQEISPGIPGNAAHPLWSPDGTRLAFTLTHDGMISVLDYNLQNRAVLNLSNLAASQGDSTHQILTLGWSSAAATPAVTWSLGSIGRISSLWLHRVGATGTLYPQLLLSGVYLQALYSSAGGRGAGCWLVVTTIAGRAGDLWRVNLLPGAQPLPLSQGKQVSLARWSPDGTDVFYLDGQNNGTGTGHLVDLASGADLLLSTRVAANPAPVWSGDGRQLAYSAGNILTVINIADGRQLARQLLPGKIIRLSWAPLATHQLLIVVESQGSALYLLAAQHATALPQDHPEPDDTLQWTEIP